MEPSRHFKFCPRCGVALAKEINGSRLECTHCGFTFFFNPTVATACFISDRAGRILLIRRAKEPSRGKLGPPGGFIDIGERAEDGVRREVREEVGLEVENLRFLGSFPNRYDYREITYPVLDFFFTADAVSNNLAAAPDEVLSLEWVDPKDIAVDDLAFPSMKAAFLEFLRQASGI